MMVVASIVAAIASWGFIFTGHPFLALASAGLTFFLLWIIREG